ncbi:MAG: two-component regulator propeller domain-containing protein [Bacteroidales bacterium]|nr:two-component regulator propeller domain-containing protein [Bacteroidales bacterium]
MKKLLFLWLFICLSVAPLFSETFSFRHLSVEDGLSSNMVRTLLQDKYGFIWIGTDMGLNRYDGATIKVYRYDAQIPNGFISALYEGEDAMWVGTDRGLFLYSYETESFSLFQNKTVDHVAITSGVNSITRDKDGNYWVATNEQGVFKYNPSVRLLEQYTFSVWSGLVSQIFVDSDNRVWAITNQNSHSIYRLNKVKNEFESFELHAGSGEVECKSLVLLEDSENSLWLGSWENGIYKIDRYSGQVQHFLRPSDGYKTLHIHSMLEYAPHKLQIGTDDGLGLFDMISGNYELFTDEETNPNAISNRFVYPLVKDTEGGIWVGTFYGGLNYISPFAGQFDSFSHSNYSNSVSGNVIGRFCEDTEGNVWIASDDGGLNCFHPQTNRFDHYLPQQGSKSSISNHNVHALCLDGNHLWVGTYSGGINVLNIKTGTFKTYTFDSNNPKSPDGTSAYVIFKDAEENIWVTSMQGVNLYNRKEDNFIRVKNLGSLTIDIKQDTKGNIWFATQGKGLFKYDPLQKKWTNYLHDKSPTSLTNDQVNSILIDKEGKIWIGTMNGLCTYNADLDHFEQVDLDIPSRNISAILEDEHVLWLTTSNGLVRYEPGTGCKVFTKSDGLLSNQFVTNAAIKTSDGKIYVGTVKGFNSFSPNKIHSNKIPPAVVITGLEIFNKEVNISQSPLPVSPLVMKQLTLSYKDDVFSLRYAALSYTTPEKIQYAYKLEGFDKDWNYVGIQNKATYTNIPPGNYVFTVKACNGDGVWNQVGRTLPIEILPPFYLTPFFKLLYLLLIIALFLTVIYLLHKRTQKKHVAEIKSLQENKEKEVHEAKIQFFTTIAHEIRTPVSLIIAPLEKILSSASALPAAIRDDLNMIDRNSNRLLLLVNQLLDFRKVEQEGMKIRCKEQDIIPLLKSVSERFIPSVLHQGIRFIEEYPEDPCFVCVDGEALTKMVSNLLTNASKYTKDEIKLSCAVQSDLHSFTIRVTDNGVGISKQDQKRIFEPFYQSADHKSGTGIGLSIVKSVVEAHNGLIEVESGLGKGTSFIVTLPISQPERCFNSEEMEMHAALPEDILSDTPALTVKDKMPVMLIVDDNEEMLTFLSDSFSEIYQIVTAHNGVEALDKLKTNSVTLILSDWMMPDMDGVELCKSVRSDQLTSHIPFILLTAKTDMSSKIEGMDCGADAYIEKPFSIHYLKACIKNLVDQRKLLRQKFSKMPMVPLNSIAGNSADEEFLNRMNEIIEQNFSNPDLSVDSLAEQLFISRSGLFSKIRTLAEVTPNELIQLVRLKKAASILLENKYRVSEICYMVGFNNPSYFTKCFQKQFGVKPSEYVGNEMNSSSSVR